MLQSILVVDDDEDDRKIVEETLREVGLHLPVHKCPGGHEAIRFLEENAANLPALIILDLNMPKINGMQVLEIVRKEYRDVPIIMYTTTCTDEIVQQAKSFGAIGCAKKGTSYSDNLKFAMKIKDFLLDKKSRNFQ